MTRYSNLRFDVSCTAQPIGLHHHHHHHHLRIYSASITKGHKCITIVSGKQNQKSDIAAPTWRFCNFCAAILVSWVFPTYLHLTYASQISYSCAVGLNTSRETARQQNRRELSSRRHLRRSDNFLSFPCVQHSISRPFSPLTHEAFYSTWAEQWRKPQVNYRLGMYLWPCGRWRRRRSRWRCRPSCRLCTPGTTSRR